ncbi:MAG: sigma 54-interacting transcriptional regulator [Proteobacteria bacterium]|nr:sigma 54-interacting transcriptional regulator [Pseudomonadota bacterium]
MAQMPAGRPSPSDQTTTIIAVDGRPVAVRIQTLALAVLDGAEAGQRSVLDRRTLAIGSHPSNDLVLSDRAVSRFHCTIACHDTGHRIVDRDSANGTYVNGVRIRDAYLPDDARIQVGSTTLQAHVDGGERDIALAEDEHLGPALGRSVPMREVFALVRRAAVSTATILISGETGTGKDVIAQAIHECSDRRERPFVVFDCSAVAATLIESALFGHQRGAFTGAISDQAGVFERAHGGTLFLDEIGELPVELQAKLLRALDSRTITRVGGQGAIAVDVRVVAATNRDLRAMVQDESFRSDLYYRLAVITIELPPLRQRTDDIPLLAAHFLRDILQRDGHSLDQVRPYLDDAFGQLAAYSWPGNVRELRNLVERAAALADPAELGKDIVSRLVELRASIARTMRVRPTLQVAREQGDREYLRDVMAETRGSIQDAARIAGVHPKSLERLLRRYGVPRT